MGEIIRFKKLKPKDKYKGKALCKSGFHKWAEDKETKFDVKKGKLVTRYRCSRCGTIRTTRT